ncbi:4-hydroxy-tetrahydrodipicolinate reductase [Persicimonas caeni]|uniref:4-hydroxy-tetrahydrodipicolinate reductase n=1 Tax=Persicimonas caeni TaxID=2292766 RepID=A0A4Y6Q117_PERCE|nr:4-hydroxy-tetrahydrodipicolinate reductase [Persicimonas caeni]QDG54276.1 4-hydroxy-tetrahydrodipicolinate reductase [Persicimonas caeni]QED35497.1 4-hydroxy-tetrahydrodipicolinate reductase [Persicimonas caeni]
MDREIFVTIIGAEGRMGAELLANVSLMEGISVTDAVVRPGSESVGSVIGPEGVRVTDDMDTAVENADVVIDFSAPEACLAAAECAARFETPFVSGTTGLSEAQIAELKGRSSDAAVLWAANFSVGVNVLEQLVELGVKAAGEGFDIEICEAHHRRKVDAPSGTALFLGRAAARARDVDLDDVAVHGREGHTGARSDEEIGFQVIRGGSIVGEHTVYLAAEGERIELTHRATDRGIFARGALRAAQWMAGRHPGWYSMKDVLFGDSERANERNS